MIIIAIQIFQNRLIMQTSSIEPDYSTLHNIISYSEQQSVPASGSHYPLSRNRLGWHWLKKFFYSKKSRNTFEGRVKLDLNCKEILDFHSFGC